MQHQPQVNCQWPIRFLVRTVFSLSQCSVCRSVTVAYDCDFRTFVHKHLSLVPAPPHSSPSARTNNFTAQTLMSILLKPFVFSLFSFGHQRSSFACNQTNFELSQVSSNNIPPSCQQVKCTLEQQQYLYISIMLIYILLEH